MASLIRWEPVRELSSVQSEMNRLFGTFFDSTPSSAPGAAPLRRWIPAMDLVETSEHFVLRADLPGIAEADVKVELEDGVLTISGERRAEESARQEGYYRIERPSGSFARSLTLPEGVDADAIQAHFDRGVLEVRIAKPQQRRPQRVSIDVGSTPAAIQGSGREQPARETTTNAASDPTGALTATNGAAS